MKTSFDSNLDGATNSWDPASMAPMNDFQFSFGIGAASTYHDHNNDSGFFCNGANIYDLDRVSSVMRGANAGVAIRHYRRRYISTSHQFPTNLVWNILGVLRTKAKYAPLSIALRASPVHSYRIQQIWCGISRVFFGRRPRVRAGLNCSTSLWSAFLPHPWFIFFCFYETPRFNLELSRTNTNGAAMVFEARNSANVSLKFCRSTRSGTIQKSFWWH